MRPHGTAARAALQLGSALDGLLILDAADVLQDLRIPPGNRLEQLRGGRAGQHSIRVSDQWRICFVWTDTGPTGVELVDYVVNDKGF